MRTKRHLRWVAIASTLVMAAACSSDLPTSTQASGQPPSRFACLDFEAHVTSGPDQGKSWTGDLVLNADGTGAFTGYLVPQEYVDRDKLVVKDPSKATCRAIGQRNGLTISWFLYCTDGNRVFGTGQLTTPVPDDASKEELRGIIQGPADNDFGIYHGRNYPPYIRIISGTRG